jgi:succinate dehydrogenase/fumarate reductase cytochrome b subunit
MASEMKNLAWNLYTELRKEIVATQQLRSRAIEIKIAVVGAAVGLFVANSEKLHDDRLLLLPAFAAIFFDYLIASYSFSIKRQSRYLRLCVEDRLREDYAWPGTVPLWEQYVSQPAQRQMFSVVADLGLTGVVSVPAILKLLSPMLTPFKLAALVVMLSMVAGLVVIFADLGYFDSTRTWSRALSKRRKLAFAGLFVIVVIGLVAWQTARTLNPAPRTAWHRPATRAETLRIVSMLKRQSAKARVRAGCASNSDDACVLASRVIAFLRSAGWMVEPVPPQKLSTAHTLSGVTIFARASGDPNSGSLLSDLFMTRSPAVRTIDDALSVLNIHPQLIADAGVPEDTLGIYFGSDPAQE